MKNISISTHPIVQDCLSILRDKTTPIEVFRDAAEKISTILLTEASADLSLSKKIIQTPLIDTIVPFLDEEIVIITIFRAGLSMLHAATTLFPNANIGFVGLARNEKTAIAAEYYWKMPKISETTTVFLLDPMLATGGSLLHVLQNIKQKPKEIRLVSIISAPEGIQAIQKEFSDIKIYTGVVDERLNSQKYIVPGLGDFGDRYFGTE